MKGDNRLPKSSLENCYDVTSRCTMNTGCKLECLMSQIVCHVYFIWVLNLIDYITGDHGYATFVIITIMFLFARSLFHMAVLLSQFVFHFCYIFISSGRCVCLTDNLCMKYHYGFESFRCDYCFIRDILQLECVCQIHFMWR